MRKIVLLLVFLCFINVSKSQTLLTVAEVYDYDIGDVFIVKVGYPTPIGYGKNIITNKYYSSNLDTVFYNYDHYGYMLATCQTCSPQYDTIYNALQYITHLADSIGEGLGAKIHYLAPGCIDTAGYTGTWVDTVFYNPDFCNRLSIKISTMANGPQLFDSCYSYFEPYYGYDEYGKGIGQISHYYNTCSNGFPNCEQGSILVYYKKGTDSCGTQPFIAGIKEEHKKMAFTIFPNPLTTEASLVFSAEQKNAELELINVFGEIINRITFSGTEVTLKKDNLKEGIYYVRVKDEKATYTSKIIIR